MSVIDIVILAVIVASLIYGLMKGIINQLASLGGIVLGLIACRLFGDRMGPLMTSMVPDAFSSPQVAQAAGVIILFLLVFFFVAAIASLLRRVTHAILLGWLDRLLGGAFSVFKWLLGLSVALNLWHIVAPDSSVFHTSTLMDGEMLPGIMRIAPWLMGFLSEQMSATVNTLA